MQKASATTIDGSAGPVQVWWGDLRAPGLVDQPTWTALRSGGPRARLSRSALGHQLLRLAAAWRLAVRPSDVRVWRLCAVCGGGTHGQPRVRVGHELVALEVSLTYSVVTVAVATSVSGRVGLDVEEVCTAAEALELAPVASGAAERDALSVSPSAARGQMFTDQWTRKEAVLKVLGLGLTVPPALVETRHGDLWLPDSPEMRTAVGRVRAPGIGVINVPAPGASAAVALEGSVPEVEHGDAALLCSLLKETALSSSALGPVPIAW